MTLFIAVLMLVAGLLLLVKGADWLVVGASSIARRLRVSELAIGLTIVAFGTSLPELTVNVLSSVSGATDIAIGNIVGSNIANILLILGIAAILAPLNVRTSTVWKEIPLSFLATLVLLVAANDALIDGASSSVLSRTDGLSFAAYFLIFLWYIFGMQRAEDGHDPSKARGAFVSCGLVISGLALLIIGGKLTVDGAVTIAEALGVSQAFIGLTIVAVGTSLPELATSAVAAVRGKADIAIGNIVGSNIFNIFWILGVSALIRPLPFQPAFNVDLLVALLATVILFLMVHSGRLHRRLFLFFLQKENHGVQRSEGLLMLLLYIGYIVYLVWRG